MNQPQPSQPPTHGGFDPDTYCPARSPAAELYDRGPGDPEESRYLLTGPKGDRQLVLSESDRLLWDMFDGKTTVNEVCQQYLNRHRSLVLNRLYSLIERLWQYGYLTEDPQMATTPLPRSRTRLRNWCRLPVPGSAALAGLLAPLARRLPIERGWFQTTTGLFVAAGFFAFSALGLVSVYPLLQISQNYETTWFGFIHESYILGVFLLLLLHLAGSFAHHLWRSAQSRALTGKAERIYFQFNYFLPVFHHEGRWLSVLPAGQRLSAASSGVAAELMLAAIGTFILHANPFAAGASEVLYKFTYLCYLRTFLHLSPFPGSDLPWIMALMGNLRDLHRRAYGFLRHSLVSTLRGDPLLSAEHKFYLAYNLIAVFWLGLAATFVITLISAHEFMLRNLYLVITQPDYAERLSQTVHASGQAASDLMIIAEERWFLAILIGGALLAVIGALLAVVCWCAYVLRCWVRDQPIWREPPAIVGIGLLLLILFYGGLYGLFRQGFLGPDEGSRYLRWATVMVGLCGALFLVLRMRSQGPSRMGARVDSYALALLLATATVFFDRHPAGPYATVTRILLVAVMALLAICLMLGLACKHHPVAYRDSPLLLPEITSLVGTIVLFAGAWRGFQLDPALLPSVDHNRFVGMALVLIGNLSILQVFREFDVELDSLALDLSQDTPEQALKRTLSFVMESLARVFGSKVGEAGLESMEKYMNSDPQHPEFGFSSIFVPDNAGPEEIGRLYRERLMLLANLSSSRYGREFTDQAFDRVFRRVHWECKQYLQSYVFPGTPWERRYRGEQDLAAAQRLKLLDSISIFHELAPNERELLARHTVVHHYEPGELIARQGEYGETCFILIDGEVQVEEEDVTGERRLIAFLRGNDFFGETALLESVPRIASVRATTRCRLLALTRDDFLQFAQLYPEMVHRIRERLHNLQAMLRIPLFGDLPTALLRTVLPRVRAAHYPPGADIVVEGDPGKEFFLVRTGHVEVLATKGDLRETICDLGPRDYFGEIALLRDIPRTATVRAAEPTDLLVLDKDDFFQLMRGSRLFAQSVQLTGEERLSQG